MEDVDLLQRSLLGSIANMNFLDDTAWTQASLPVWSGALGIWSVTQLAPSAFFAAAVCSSVLISQLLLPCLRDVPNSLHSKALKIWKEGHDESHPPATASMCQESWVAPKVNSGSCSSWLQTKINVLRLTSCCTKEGVRSLVEHSPTFSHWAVDGWHRSGCHRPLPGGSPVPAS